MILFKKQIAVFFTSKNFFVTFTKNLFLTKPWNLLWDLPLGDKDVFCCLEVGKKKNTPIFCYSRGRKADGRCVIWDLFVSEWRMPSVEGTDMGFANQSWVIILSISTTLSCLKTNLSLWLKLLFLSKPGERNSSTRLQCKELWRMRICGQYCISAAQW